MQHQDALAGQVGVPTGLGAVLQQVVFIGVGVVGDLDSGSRFAVEGRKRVLGILNGVDEVHPSHEMPFIGRVTRRSVAVIQVTAVVHDIPVAHAIVVAIVGGIEIRQAQAVTELVAEGADAVDCRAEIAVSLQLVENGIPVNRHAVELERARGAAAPIIGFLHVPLAGPHALGDRAIGLCLAHTGIEHDNDIDIAVTIVVIV